MKGLEDIGIALGTVALSVLGWGVWVTKAIFGQDTRHARLCTKIDALHEDVRDIKEALKEK